MSVYIVREVFLRRIITIFFLLILISCSSNTIYKTDGVSNRQVHKKFGTTEESNSEGVEEKGKILYFVTSYYGSKFHGRHTSNGEIFDMYKLTCAHKTLPFGTVLRVTNEDNNKSVTVRINDRGPFVSGRDLDLSYAAAKEIGLIAEGVKKLKVEILEQP